MCECAGYVYRIVNVKTEECYIGQTINTVEHRFSEHCVAAYEAGYGYYNKFSKNKLYSNMRKHGKEAFQVTTLETVKAETIVKLWQRLLPREAYWIEYYDSIRSGYNTLPGLKNEKNVKAYIRKNILDRIFTSNVCGYRFSSYKSLALHKHQFHNGPSPFQCGYCRVFNNNNNNTDYFADTESLQDHVKRVHPEKPFRLTEFCYKSDCDFVTDCQRTLRIHICQNHKRDWTLCENYDRKRKRPEESIIGMVCKGCNFSSDNPKVIANHVDFIHGEEEIVLIDGTRNENEHDGACKWRLCGQVLTPDHEEKRHGIYHPCKFCNMQFLFECLLQRHVSEVHLTLINNRK